MLNRLGTKAYLSVDYCVASHGGEVDAGLIGEEIGVFLK